MDDDWKWLPGVWSKANRNRNHTHNMDDELTISEIYPELKGLVWSKAPKVDPNKEPGPFEKQYGRYRRRSGEDDKTYNERYQREVEEARKEKRQKTENVWLFGKVSSLRTPMPYGVEDYQKSTVAVSRTLIRRELDYNRKYKEQVGRGRPDGTWHQCGDSLCFPCSYTDLVYVPGHHATYGGSKPVSGRAQFFVDAMMKHFYGKWSLIGKDTERRLLESFIHSPPIKGALGQFDFLCGNRGWAPSFKKVALTLTSIRPAVLYLVSTTRDAKPIEDAHDLLEGAYNAFCPRDWKLEHLTLQFCVRAESWRRYGIEHGAKWEFGSDEAVADFLCALLMDFYIMIRHRAAYVRRFNGLRLKDLWESWLDEYHVFSEWAGESRTQDFEDAEYKKPDMANESDCLSGFGQADTPWMSAQMKHSST